MDSFFIEAYQESEATFLVGVETLEVLFVFNIVQVDNVQLYLKLQTEQPSESYVKVDLKHIKYDILSDVPETALYCKWPVIVKGTNVISGLCSVVRQLVKYSENKVIRDLLGFRNGCLMACAETSVWTKFCEVDTIETTKKVLNNKYHNSNTIFIPEDIARFEMHMSKPVRTHNVWKIAREKHRQLKSDTPVENFNLEHSFSEGVDMTLADVSLYSCFDIFFQKYPLDVVKEKLPFSIKWYEKMNNLLPNKLCLQLSKVKTQIMEAELPKILEESLYKGDLTRSRSAKRIYTKQNFIDNAINQLQSLKNHIFNENIPFGLEIEFDWSNMPLEVNPNGGALPEKRAGRKCEQLQNLVRAVAKITVDKQSKIVDFCSGSGLLGILIAAFLPNCEIVLVENKERSLARAQRTVEKLGLNNVTVVQSNLDYFKGNYDIGVALHACGVATDLVIQNCIDRKAHFVSCPCCYGGIKDCHLLSYPRSKEF